MRACRVIVPLALGLLVTSGVDQTTFAARGNATRSVVYGQHGMVCAAQPLAVQAGLDILKQGGSAAHTMPCWPYTTDRVALPRAA